MDATQRPKCALAAHTRCFRFGLFATFAAWMCASAVGHKRRAGARQVWSAVHPVADIQRPVFWRVEVHLARRRRIYQFKLDVG